MGTLRKLAGRLLRVVLRLVPEESRDWAAAMLRELDFIEGDWAALLWAFGSVTAILRHAASVFRTSLKRQTKEGGMNNTGKKALGVGLGALYALMLVGCAFAGLRLIAILFPGLGLDHAPWTFWLAVVVVPEVILVAATVQLWRKRGPLAAGVLATGLVVGLHLAVHLAMR
ncbi:MAG: hypothetical protein ABR923_04785 [Terracidiphilus sp.]|jgi:hypothetical protein